MTVLFYGCLAWSSPLTPMNTGYPTKQKSKTKKGANMAPLNIKEYEQLPYTLQT
jgi:hypothetical protein